MVLPKFLVVVFIILGDSESNSLVRVWWAAATNLCGFSYPCSAMKAYLLVFMNERLLVFALYFSFMMPPVRTLSCGCDYVVILKVTWGWCGIFVPSR